MSLIEIQLAAIKKLLNDDQSKEDHFKQQLRMDMIHAYVKNFAHLPPEELYKKFQEIDRIINR